MKTMNIFGRKISVVAILIVALLVGTASAALITNYAILTGTVDVSQTVFVVGDGADEDSLNMIDGEASFTINVDEAMSMNLVTTLMLDRDGVGSAYGPESVSDTAGITITYEVDTDASISYELTGLTGIPDQVMPVTTGANIVTINFDGVPNLETGTYTVQVEVNPIA